MLAVGTPLSSTVRCHCTTLTAPSLLLRTPFLSSLSSLLRSRFPLLLSDAATEKFESSLLQRNCSGSESEGKRALERAHNQTRLCLAPLLAYLCV
jgi:hypothetical protein